MSQVHEHLRTIVGITAQGRTVTHQATVANKV